MKIVLDLTDLVQRGELTGEEAKRFERLAAKDTGALLIGFAFALRWFNLRVQRAKTAGA